MSRDYYGMINKSDLKGKYIFWDIDGTLAAFRFNGHLADPDGSHNGMSLSEIENGCFYYREPSRLMRKVIRECGAKKQYILGHCHAEKEISDKKRWIREKFPEINDTFFIEDEVPKYTVIHDFCSKNAILPQDVVFVDDKISILIEAERHGIPSYHISSFLDWDY